MEKLEERNDVLLNDELLNFWEELNFLKEWFGPQVLKTLDDWDSYDEDVKNDKALGITQWIQDLEINKSKLNPREKNLLDKLCNSWRWEILVDVLNQETNRKEIYELIKKIQWQLDKKN